MDDRGFGPRRRSVAVEVGGVIVGGGRPIVVQSMTNTDTADVDATAIQVARLADAGSELVRITVNTEAAAAAVPEIVRKVRGLGAAVPIVGDFHYNGHKLLRDYPEAAKALAKYRINPGNVGPGRHHDEHFAAIVGVAIDNDKPSVTLVHKGNIMKYTEGAFRSWGYDLAESEFGEQVYTQRQWERTRAEKGEAAANAERQAALEDGCIPVKDITAC